MTVFKKYNCLLFSLVLLLFLPCCFKVPSLSYKKQILRQEEQKFIAIKNKYSAELQLLELRTDNPSSFKKGLQQRILRYANTCVPKKKWYSWAKPTKPATLYREYIEQDIHTLKNLWQKIHTKNDPFFINLDHNIKRLIIDLENIVNELSNTICLDNKIKIN